MISRGCRRLVSRVKLCSKSNYQSILAGRLETVIECDELTMLYQYIDFSEGDTYFTPAPS